MPTNHSKFSLGYYVIWCPKYRHQILKDVIKIELKQVLAETCAHYDWNLVSLEVIPDHVHIFVQADPETARVNIAKTLKSISAVHLFNKFLTLKNRKFWGSGLWSRGTYYATVGHITEAAVRKYIETQKNKKLAEGFHPPAQGWRMKAHLYKKKTDFLRDSKNISGG